MLDQILTLVTSLFDFLQDNQKILQFAGVIGSIVSAAYTLYLRYGQSKQQRRRRVAYNKLDTLRAKVETEIVEEAGPAQERRRRATNADVLTAVHTVQNLVLSVQNENRRSLWWSFFQNLAFFLLGTLTSIVAPKFFP